MFIYCLLQLLLTTLNIEPGPGPPGHRADDILLPLPRIRFSLFPGGFNLRIDHTNSLSCSSQLTMIRGMHRYGAHLSKGSIQYCIFAYLLRDTSTEKHFPAIHQENVVRDLDW